VKTQFADHFEPLIGWQNAGFYLLLPLLVIVSQVLLQSKQSVKSDTTGGVVSVLFPMVIGISTLVSPAGLGIYWLTNNVLTGGQIQLVKSQVDEELPEYKKIFDAAAENPEQDDRRFTRATPFAEQDGGDADDLVEKSVKAAEQSSQQKATPFKEASTRKAKRAAARKQSPKSSKGRR